MSRRASAAPASPCGPRPRPARPGPPGRAACCPGRGANESPWSLRPPNAGVAERMLPGSSEPPCDVVLGLLDTRPRVQQVRRPRLDEPALVEEGRLVGDAGGLL